MLALSTQYSFNSSHIPRTAALAICDWPFLRRRAAHGSQDRSRNSRIREPKTKERHSPFLAAVIRRVPHEHLQSTEYVGDSRKGISIRRVMFRRALFSSESTPSLCLRSASLVHCFHIHCMDLAYLKFSHLTYASASKHCHSTGYHIRCMTYSVQDTGWV